MVVQILGNNCGKKRKMRGGQCEGPGCENHIAGGQAGGATTALNPAALNDSFDRMGNQLARDAHNLYVQQNYDLAALKNVNAMKGGQTTIDLVQGGRRSRRRTAKKYSRRSRKSGNKRSNKRSGNKRSNKRGNKRSGNKRSGNKRSGKRGGGLVEAVVPLGLLAAQQTLFKRGSSKKYNKYRGGKLIMPEAQ